MKINPFKPDKTLRNLLEIDPSWIIETKIDLVVLDVDNTLVEKGKDNISDAYLAWIRDLQSRGVTIVICSNNFSSASHTIAQRCGCLSLNGAFKPFRFKFGRFLAKHKVKYHKGLLIGDQIFTDISLGRAMGFMTILVNPLSTKDWISTKILRWIEKVIVKRPQ